MENHLYCYKMTWDTESAPNPYHGILTLAICKPTIRRCAKVGDWISGWTAKTVHGKKDKLYSFDKPKLIYLAKIKEKLTFAEYWNQYTQKRPRKLSNNQDPSTKKTCGGSSKGTNAIYDSGDNIYKPLIDNPTEFCDFEQVKNNNHTEYEKEHDLRGKYVLICEEFYYYGVDNAIDVDDSVFNVIVSRCKKLLLSDDYKKFIDYIRKDKRAIIQGNHEDYTE